MPPLDEGDVLYMPLALPGISAGKVSQLLQQTDRLIKTVPEVASVFGKAGRAETATDPAPLEMFETTVQFKPHNRLDLHSANFREAAMTVELKWLCYTALLAGSLWIPFIIGVNVTKFEGKDELFVRPPDSSKMRPWVHRSLRAHQNLLEQFLPFSVVVLIGAVSGVSTPVTAACVVIFFWLRVAHAIGMISGLARLPLRPMIYVSGWIVTLVYAWQVLRHGA